AQQAGAVAVLMTTPGDTGFPDRITDINPNVHIPVLVIAENYQASLLRTLLLNLETVTARIVGDSNPRLGEWNGPKGFGAVDSQFGFAVPTAGIYPMRLVAGQREGNANLEWYSIEPDGTRILINDTSNPKSLRAFRSRTSEAAPRLSPPTLANGKVTISWTGGGVLQEAANLAGPWNDVTIQANPQQVTPTAPTKFYRVRR